MPAKNLQRVAEGGIYCHVYNLGVENRNIFAEDVDYQVFLDYLKDYLSLPKTADSTKKDFTINGRAFRGVPHQPKNYFNKIELIAYCLQPNHFHLLLHQKTQKSLQAFIRSLCTRYSIYFNKKYKRSGPLFEGPYKSVQLRDSKSLLLLTRHFHKAGGYSTYHEYLGQRETPWVKTKTVLSLLQSRTSPEYKEGSYKDFVEKYEQNQEENKLFQEIVIEKINEHLERINPKVVSLKPLSRIPELIGASVVFAILLVFSFKNISNPPSEFKKTPTTLGTTTSAEPTPIPSPEPTTTPAAENSEASKSANTQNTPKNQSENLEKQ